MKYYAYFLWTTCFFYVIWYCVDLHIYQINLLFFHRNITKYLFVINFAISITDFFLVDEISFWPAYDLSNRFKSVLIVTIFNRLYYTSSTIEPPEMEPFSGPTHYFSCWDLRRTRLFFSNMPQRTESRGCVL